MSEKPHSVFTPPSAEQLAGHLRKHGPMAPTRWWPIVQLAMLAALMMLVFSAFSSTAVLLPLLVLAALSGALSWRLRRLRDLDERVSQAQELALTRHFPQATRLAWRLLPRVRSIHDLHGRAVSVLAHCLDQTGAHDAAIVAYDFLISRLPADHPGAVQLTIQRTVAQLLADRLTDADDSLRRLRAPAAEYARSPIAASYRVAELLQQVQTNHYQDAVSQVKDPQQFIGELQPLGVDAGYGYALMAMSHHRIGSADAGAWWQRATLLLPAGTIVARFSRLAELTALSHRARPEALNQP